MSNREPGEAWRDRLKAWVAEGEKTESRSAICRRAGVWKGWLEAVMSGETQDPGVTRLNGLCEALGHTLHELMTGERPPNDPEEIEFLAGIRRLPPDDREMLRQWERRLRRDRG